MSNPLTAARGANPEFGGALRCVLPRPSEQKPAPAARRGQAGSPAAGAARTPEQGTTPAQSA